MNFEQLKHRVDRSEALVDGRIRQTGECHTRLHSEWRQAWTPLRIVLAGLVAGFITGRAEPEQALAKLGKLGGPRSLQLISSLTGLLGSVQAAIAAVTAKQAAATADHPADQDATAESESAATTHADASAPAPAATAASEPQATTTTAPADSSAEAEAVPPADRRRPDQSWDTQPSPAEAATEISER